MNADQATVLSSLEVVAERCDDIVPSVYARLFEARPDLREFFAVHAGDAPRSGMGNMVNEILRMLAGDDGDLDLDCEAQATVVFHTGWGLGMDMYRDVLEAVVATVQQVCGEQWSSFAEAWHTRVDAVTEALRTHYEAIEGTR